MSQRPSLRNVHRQGRSDGLCGGKKWLAGAASFAFSQRLLFLAAKRAAFRTPALNLSPAKLKVMGPTQQLVLPQPSEPSASPEHPSPATQLATPPSPRRLGAGRTLLLFGIALRILVFCFLAPLNNDRGHALVVQYIVEHHTLPAATHSGESYQPPLYYLLAAPIWAATRSLKWVQALNLVFSILTLLVFYRLFYARKLLPSETAAQCAFGLACFLPQFVLFGLYISNDTLAVFLGALLALQTARFTARPSARSAALLALLTSLGLLTKATFLSFLPVLFALVSFVLLRRGRPAAKACAAGLALCLLAAGLGSWRFVQSYREVGDPFVSNLGSQYQWVVAQQRSYRGIESFADVNLLKLVRAPSVSRRTDGAYPLLLYGTFWYPHIPESNFRVSRHAPFYYVGSAIYLLAVIPSVFFLAGLFELAKRLWRVAARDLSHPANRVSADPLDGGLLAKAFTPSQSAVFPSPMQPNPPARNADLPIDDQHLLVAAVAAAFLLGNLVLILAVAVKWHVWSVMQGRLLFPSFAGMLLPFGEGVAALAKNRRATALLAASILALAICFCLYYTTEISSQLGGWPFV